MFKAQLPLDYSRCYGGDCSQRDTCLRYTTIESDSRIAVPVRISYSNNLCFLDREFTGTYKITKEIE